MYKIWLKHQFYHKTFNHKKLKCTLRCSNVSSTKHKWHWIPIIDLSWHKCTPSPPSIWYKKITVVFPVPYLFNCTNSQVLIEVSLTPLLFVHQLTFGLQLDRHVTENTTVIGLRVQFLLEVTFFLNLFCSNTILASFPEWSTLGKARMSEERKEESEEYADVSDGDTYEPLKNVNYENTKNMENIKVYTKLENKQRDSQVQK